MQLQQGDEAPQFELQDAEGRTWSRDPLKGKKVVLFFYPADDTPGCTIEACDFRDAHEDLQSQGYTVLGVSPQGQDSKRAFTEKYSLNFPLLIDHDGEVAKRYGVWEERGDYNGIPLTIRRATFVIDEEGRIGQAMYDVKANGHVAQIRESLSV